MESTSLDLVRPKGQHGTPVAAEVQSYALSPALFKRRANRAKLTEVTQERNSTVHKPHLGIVRLLGAIPRGNWLAGQRVGGLLFVKIKSE